MVIRRSKSLLPTPAEIRILQSLWELGKATVEEIVNFFPARERPKYKTVQTFLRIMEQKKFVAHSVQGRVFIFEPIVERDEVNRRSVQLLLQQNFAGSASGLLVNLLSLNSVDPGDLEQIEQMLREYKGRHAPVTARVKEAK